MKDVHDTTPSQHIQYTKESRWLTDWWGKGKAIYKHHATKMYEGVDVQLHSLFISALDAGEWSASRPVRFTTGEKPPTPLDRRLGGPTAGLDTVACLCRKSNRVVQPVA
jgi:hypothetical protein